MQSNPLEKVNDTIDEMIQMIVMEVQKNNVNTSSFYVFLISIITTSMNIVEEMTKDKEGHVKKYIVVAVGRAVVEKFYPDHLEFYNQQVDTIIELMITSYYELKKNKHSSKLHECFPFLF
jgi:hypothetical protein